MFEKNLEINTLLDFYGDVLPERKRILLEMYYNDDLSLAEIADDVGISRQGVRNTIKKAECELIYLEEKLGLYKKFKTSQTNAGLLLRAVEASSVPADIKEKIRDFTNIVSSS